jgi:hypothetical protein
VTEPELLQENKNDIVGNNILHCGKLMDIFNTFYKEHGQNEPRCELSCLLTRIMHVDLRLLWSPT